MLSFDAWPGPPLRVFAAVPARVRDDTPVLFVMHGVLRDADRYAADWAPHAHARGAILAVPEFDAVRFPGARGYNRGGVRAGDRRVDPRGAFAAIEPLFDALRASAGTRVPDYALYGHSAGAQYAHRWLMLASPPRARVVVAANAGSYAMPDPQVDWPFGLRGAPIGADGLRRALAAPLVVLAGTADTDPGHPNLPREPAAAAQGPHRAARAARFVQAGEAAARRLGVPFGWRLHPAPGIGHDDAAMVPHALPLLLGPARAG